MRHYGRTINEICYYKCFDVIYKVQIVALDSMDNNWCRAQILSDGRILEGTCEQMIPESEFNTKYKDKEGLRFLLLILSCLIGFSSFSAETVLTGKASYYTIASCQKEGTSGVFTANGERYDENQLTCAMQDKRCYRKKNKSVYFKVTNLDNNKYIIVRLNDRGPGKIPLKKGIIIDLTPKAFQELGGKLKNGLINVKVEEVK